MKFNVQCEALYSHLLTLKGMLANKNTISILDSFLFLFSGKELTIVASDGDNFIKTTLGVIDNDTPDARFCANGKLIMDALRGIAAQPISLSVDFDKLSMQGNYTNGKFKITVQSANDYPAPLPLENTQHSISIASGTFLSAITKCLPCTKDDEIRPIMSGICFNVLEGNIDIAATDGYKLMKVSVPKSQDIEPYTLIISKKCAIMLKAILSKGEEMVQIVSDGKMIKVITESKVLYGKLVDGKYPNYAALLLKEMPFKVTVDRQDLTSAIKRVSTFTDPSSCLVRAVFNGDKCDVSGRNYEFAMSAEEHINCISNNADITIGFKGYQLTDMLSLVSYSEQIELQLADPTRPCIMKPMEEGEGEQTTMLLMPMKLVE